MTMLISDTFIQAALLCPIKCSAVNFKIKHIATAASNNYVVPTKYHCGIQIANIVHIYGHKTLFSYIFMKHCTP